MNLTTEAGGNELKAETEINEINKQEKNTEVVPLLC